MFLAPGTAYSDPRGHSLNAASVVLVIEDPFIFRLLDGLLARSGYAAVAASSSRAAQVLRSPEGRVSAVVTNNPEDFLEFAAKVPLLYLAAWPDPALAERFRHCRTLRKPFQPRDLIEALDSLTRAAVG